MSRLRPRRIARSLARKRTLPQRLWREARWLWRDLKDAYREFSDWTDKHVAGTPRQEPDGQ